MPGSLNSNAWFVQFRPNPQARLRLFCFPYAGGGPHVFRGWLDNLPPWIDLIVAQLPGHGTRILESNYRDVKDLVPDLVSAFLPELDRPYAVFGHSLGALLSFEVVRNLQNMGRPLPLHLFVSARMAPQLPDPYDPVYDLPENDFIAHLKKINGTPSQVLESKDLMEIFLPVLRADFQLNETYLYQHGPKLQCPVTVFGGVEDPRISKEDLHAWGELSGSEFNMTMFPGDHFFLHSLQDGLVQLITDRLSSCESVPSIPV